MLYIVLSQLFQVCFGWGCVLVDQALYRKYTQFHGKYNIDWKQMWIVLQTPIILKYFFQFALRNLNNI